MKPYLVVIFLAAYVASMTIPQHSPVPMSMMETQLMNLTCEVPTSLQWNELYQLEISFSRRNNFSHSLVSVSRQEHYKDLSFGYVPDLFNASGQLFERNASSSFLILTFPLTENSHGLYTCTTSYRLRDEKRKESQSFYVGGPSTIKKSEGVDGFSVTFTPVLRVQGKWDLPALQNPTLVYGSVNISEKFVAGDRETCSSDHPDIGALNFSHIYHSAKNEHILSLDACIKVPTRCGSVVYITGEDKVFITVQVNLNPEVKERGTSTDSANRSQPHEKGPDTNTSSPFLQETTHSLTEQRVIFTFLGLFMGISLTCLLVYIKRFCMKRHENPQHENNRESEEMDSLLVVNSCEKTLEVVDVGVEQDVTPVSMMSQDVQLKSGRTADHSPGSVTSGDPLRSAPATSSEQPLTSSHRTTTVTDLDKESTSVVSSGVTLGPGDKAGHRESARPVCQPELDCEAVDDSVRSGGSRVIEVVDSQVTAPDLNPISGSASPRHPPATGSQGYSRDPAGVEGDAGENVLPPVGLVDFREE